MSTNVSDQIRELENRLHELRSSQVVELREELREARQRVASLEAQIAAATGGSVPTVVSTGRRKRTSSEEVRGRIFKVLSSQPEGLSQKEISDKTGLNYNTVVIYLKNNAKEFKTTGTFRSKRFFLR